MTEKRFTIKSQDDYFGITDNNVEDKMNVINGIHTEIEAKWLCDLLNEQHETIERLKQNINELLSVNVEEDLLKENEQLKARITYLERKIQRERLSAMKEHEKWEKELKATIKEAYENERTQLGKSVLKQLLNKME